jgi:hypothetical protein
MKEAKLSLDERYNRPEADYVRFSRLAASPRVSPEAAA